MSATTTSVPAACHLLAAVTCGAHVQRDLVAAASVVCGSTEDVTGHGEQQRVVVEMAARGALEALHRFSKRRNLELFHWHRMTQDKIK